MLRSSVLVVVCAVAALVGSSPVFGGPLTPPGAPAPSMRTLAEVEPRIPIGPLTTPGDADSVFKITQPGSYYLTGNVVGQTGRHGIEIASSNVSLDLMGFTLDGQGVGLEGVRSTVTVRNVEVVGGTIQGWTGDGIDLFSVTGGVVQRIRADGCGAAGIRVGESFTISDCVAIDNGGAGIATGDGAVVTSCTASRNQGAGIGAGVSSSVSNCIADSNGIGISASFLATISSCVATRNGTTGISATSSSIIVDCTASENDLHGIQVSFNSIVRGNTCSLNGAGSTVTNGAGIRVANNRVRVEGNSLIGNDIGLNVAGSDNFIVRNSAASNTTNYSIVANNHVGVIVNAPNSLAISGSTGGAGVGSTDPWANFSH